MKKSGFLMIELMVVIAIIAILAMITAPNIMKLLAKAKRAEAYANLRSIYGAQRAYFAENGAYTNILSGPGGVGWKPEGYQGGGAKETYNYTYGFPGAEGVNYFTGKLEASGSALGGAKADKMKFLAYAAGDIDNDGKLDVLSIDERGAITIVQDDLAD